MTVEERFERIRAMQTLVEARSTKVIKTVRRVHFAPENETTKQAFNALFEMVLRPSNKPSKRSGHIATPADNARLWGEAFIRCGRCKSLWNQWFEQNPLTLPHREWVKRAIRFVFRKRLI